MNITDLIKNNHDYFQDFISRSTYHSNAIEGNTLSYAETHAILWNDNSFKISAEPREWYEAINHKHALSYVIEQASCNEPLSETMIKKIGIMINKGIKEIDGYRKIQVLIKGAEHMPPAANMVQQHMMHFIDNYNHTCYSSVFEKIARNHILFEQIHPFEDGNGRTGRLLINFELLKNNLAPIVIPKEERIQYFKLLAQNNDTELADYFYKLSVIEQERIQQFEMNSEYKIAQEAYDDYAEHGKESKRIEKSLEELEL